MAQHSANWKAATLWELDVKARPCAACAANQHCFYRCSNSEAPGPQVGPGMGISVGASQPHLCRPCIRAELPESLASAALHLDQSVLQERSIACGICKSVPGLRSFTRM